LNELKQIVDAYDRALADGQRAALATVVKVEGSSYRQPGARMLVTEDGNLTGAISGGCLEGDAMRKALLVIARNQPMVFTYDTSDENSGFLAVGLGCNGIVHILFEPLPPEKPNAIDLIRGVLGERDRTAILTCFSIAEPRSPAATCLVLHGPNRVVGSLPDGLPSEVILAAGQEALSQGISLIRNFKDGIDWSVLADVVFPPVSLIIAGAGNDVIPVVKMADVLGWQTSVLDGRPSHATCRRFPEAAQVVVADALHALEGLSLDYRTAVVLMTHNYQYDLALLEQLIDSEVAYIGILGPKSKTKKLMDDLPRNKQRPALLEKVHGPAGLDLGSETSDEIALSILSEIKTVLAGKDGTPLRFKNTPIHQPTPERSVSGITDNKI
jgi:xanthine/CO dehydrogenase XdhC/CoxF family maturation factor